jgi:putative heme iron utilization protein
MPRPDPVQPPDAAACTLARTLLAEATHAALAFTDPTTGAPAISRIALAPGPDGTPLTLISGLAPHTAALQAHPACALMVGEVPDRGDPLAHPRLMIRAQAAFAPAQERAALRGHWLALRPKSTLYVDLPDFAFVRLHPEGALLNGGFARAFRLAPADLM